MQQVHIRQFSGAKVGIAAAAILCVVGMALDITSIVYTSRQIHVYRKKKKDESKTSSITGDSTSDKSCLSSSPSTVSLSSNDYQYNNKIYLKSVDRELNSDHDLCSWATIPSGGFPNKKSNCGGELWADVVSSGGSFWKDECVEGLEPNVEPSLSRRSSGSWEKVNEQFYVSCTYFASTFATILP